MEPTSSQPLAAQNSSAGAVVSVRPSNGAMTDSLELVDAEGFVTPPAAHGYGYGYRYGTPVPLTVGRLMRWKWTIAGVALLAAVTAIPLIWMFVVPMYRSKALVRVSPVVQRLVYRTEETGIMPMYRTYLNTQCAIILSAAVLERVLDDPDVRRTHWHHEEARTFWGTPLTPLERLMHELSVRPGGDDELIEVSLATLHASDARIIVNTVVREYEKLSIERALAQDAALEKTLMGLRDEYSNQIENLSTARDKIAGSLGTLATDELRSTLTTQLSVLEADAARLKRELNMTKWRLSMLDNAAAADEAGTAPPRTEHRYAADPEWRALNIDLEKARTDVELVQQNFGDFHPRIKQAQASAEHAERVLRAREKQLEEQWELALPGSAGSDPLVSSRAALERLLREQEEELLLRTNEIKAQTERVDAASAVAHDIAWYDEQLRQKRGLFDDVRERLKVLQTESKAPVNVQIAAMGFEPSRPDQDRRIILTLLALVGALALGVGAGYLRSTTDPRVREADDVLHAVRAPFLGQLPKLPRSTDLVSDASPPLLEAMRMVRTVLLERCSSGDRHVVLVTSASAQTGKSSIALLLARSLALVGKRVLLVEADLHRPSLSGRLQLEPKRGLATLLTGDAADSDVILHTSIPKLDVLLAGQRSPAFDPELLANGVFSACLRRWKSVYDLVVLDSPPVLPVADARILARQADGTIMVLRSAHDRKPDVTRAYADLSAAGGKLLGTVLVNERFGSHYGYPADYQAYDTGSAAARD